MLQLGWSRILTVVCTLSALVICRGNDGIVSIRTDKMPVKGSNVRITCAVSTSTTWAVNERMFVYRESEYIETCLPASCSRGGIITPRMNVTADLMHIYIDIENLNRSEDETDWSCELRTIRDSLILTVYTLPTSLTYVNLFQQPQVLSENSVSFTCETASCTYKDPVFTMYYQKGFNQERAVWSSPTTDSRLSAGCSDSERIYFSTLTLPRNTTTPDNEDLTTKFWCKLSLSYGNFQSTLESTQTPNVTFAVKLTGVTLMLRGSKPMTNETLYVTADTHATFTCQPSQSRPLPTITWYIGETVKQTQTSSMSIYDLTATENVHGKKIYCQAYNFQPEDIVVSNKPILYVKVKVEVVAIKQGNVSLAEGAFLTVTEDKITTLSCDFGKSRPSPTVSWYINDTKQASSGAQFTFTPYKNYHGLTIYCRAYNTYESESVSSPAPIFFVRVEAGSPIIITGDINITIFDGEKTTIRCQSTPTRPAAIMTWIFEGFSGHIPNNTEKNENEGLISVISSISITGSPSLNGHTITCQSRITGQMQPQNATKIVIIWWSPSKPIVKVQPMFPWLEGRSGTLTCFSINTGHPKASIEWIGEIVAEDMQNLLVMSDLSYTDDGRTVQCKMDNVYTETKSIIVQSDTIALDVEYKPIVTIKYGNSSVSWINVTEGQNIETACAAVGNPNPTVKWLENALPGEHLSFADINRTQSNNYTCRASAKSQTYTDYEFLTETVLELIVFYPPVVEVHQSTDDLREHESVKLTCLPIGLPAVYTYHGWTQTWQDTEISSNPSVRTTSEYIYIPSLQLQDSGNYTCQVDNSIMDRNNNSIQSGTTELRVKVSPKIFILEPVYVGILSENITISIPFYAYPSYSIVSLRQNNIQTNHRSDKFDQVIKESEVMTEFYRKAVILMGHYLNFTVYGLTERDFSAEYTVRITNALNTTEKSFRITAESKPLIPSNFRVQKQIGNTIILYWEKSFNGGHTQRFLIQITEANKENWKNRTIVDEFDETKNLGNKSYIANITELKPGAYRVRIIASNNIGQTDPVTLGSVVTVVLPGENPDTSSNVGLIAGGAAGVFVLVAITAVLVSVIVRRRHDCFKSPSKCLLKDNERPGNTRGTDDTPEINLNPMYESAGPQPSSSNNSDVYSQVDKNRKKAEPFVEIYSQVNKPKKQQNSGGSEVKNDVYAQVQKQTHKEKDAGTAKHKKQKPDKKTKKGKQTEGRVCR